MLGWESWLKIVLLGPELVKFILFNLNQKGVQLLIETIHDGMNDQIYQPVVAE